MSIKPSELILNPDGSVYHLKLKPGQVANTIITVGDQDRVSQVTKHFDSIEFTTQKREFKTQTGTFKGKRLTVISTGIGPDNIEIFVMYGNCIINCIKGLLPILLGIGNLVQHLFPLGYIADHRCEHSGIFFP